MEMIRVMRTMGSRIEMALGQNRRMTDSHRGNTHENHGSFNHEDHGRSRPSLALCAHLVSRVHAHMYMYMLVL